MSETKAEKIKREEESIRGKKMTKIECDFCGSKCDGKIILRDALISKEDGSNVILCSSCLNHYANGEYDKIKLKGGEDEK